MKYLSYLSLFLLLVLASCKKDAVDGSSVKSFQSSINDMATSLNTLEQTKFNEALYILKTFGAEGKTDVEQLEFLAQWINGKKVPEILSLADEVARKNDVDWSSTAPPSLGEMNIFQNIVASEVDTNDVSAAGLQILVQPIEVDSISGPKALRIIPKLVDNSGNPVSFENAALETTMEVFSNGTRLLSSKNLMTNPDFKGFYLKLSSLPSDKIVDAKIDIKASVKTTKRVYQLLKTGILINENALAPAKAEEIIPDEIEPSLESTENSTETPKNLEKPEAVVGKFLNNLSSKNFRAAYDISENPAWGSYDKFSNANSGFGAVENIKIKSISAKSPSLVTAVYEVKDKDGNITLLNASYGLKQTESGWKISNYKINSSEKK